MRNLRNLLVAILATALIALGLTSCGSSNSDDTLRPASMPVINGEQYCGYVATPQECVKTTADMGVTIPQDHWFQYPENRPAQTDPNHDVLDELLTYYMVYNLFFSSPYYSDRYVPTAYRTTFNQHTTVIHNHYGGEFSKYQAQARYRTSSGKIVSGSKINANRFTVKNNGGGGGGRNCGMSSLNNQPIELSALNLRGGGGGGGHSGGGSRSGGGGKVGGNKGSGSKKGGC